MKTVKVIIILITALSTIRSLVSAQEMPTINKDSSMHKMNLNDKTMDNQMSGRKMIHEKINTDMNGTAIRGYDAVAYFTDNTAVMGNSMYSYDWMGAEWHFRNEQNKMMFIKNPEKYAPQYGGFCAFGASMNHLSEADPTAWKIQDGKLYLLTNAGAAKKFNEDTHSCIMKADDNWHELGMKNDKDGM